jgi:peptidoglycan/LPS O-acetylase OafA/YrhL
MKKGIVVAVTLLTMAILRGSSSRELHWGLAIVLFVLLFGLLVIYIRKKKKLSEILFVLAILILCSLVLLIYYQVDKYNSVSVWTYLICIFFFFVLLPIIGAFNAYETEDWNRLKKIKILMVVFIIVFIILMLLVLTKK